MPQQINHRFVCQPLAKPVHLIKMQQQLNLPTHSKMSPICWLPEAVLCPVLCLTVPAVFLAASSVSTGIKHMAFIASAPLFRAVHHSTALNSTWVHCTSLYCTEFYLPVLLSLHCITLQWSLMHCLALHCAATHSTALHCTALQCNKMHWALLNCTVLRWGLCTVLICTEHYCTVVHFCHCTEHYCTVLHFSHCTEHYCTVLHFCHCTEYYCTVLHFCHCTVQCTLLFCTALLALHCKLVKTFCNSIAAVYKLSKVLFSNWCLLCKFFSWTAICTVQHSKAYLL